MGSQKQHDEQVILQDTRSARVGQVPVVQAGGGTVLTCCNYCDYSSAFLALGKIRKVVFHFPASTGGYFGAQ